MQVRETNQPATASKKILVLSFDFDGCLFNNTYLYSESKNRLLEANEKLITDIVKQILDQDYDEVITMVGSSRQSKAVDDHNASMYNRGSCFSALDIITAEIQKRISKSNSAKNPKCHRDGYLLADSYGGRTPGENFANALSGNNKYHYSHWVYDDTKLSISYAQMHHIASKNKDAEITYFFYDDRYGYNDILHGHAKFFHPDNKDLIPHNLQLCLRHYAGGLVTSVGENMQGTGEIDLNYSANTLYMVKCAGYDAAHAGEVDVRASISNGDRLMQFRNGRNTDFGPADEELSDENAGFRSGNSWVANDDVSVEWESKTASESEPVSFLNQYQSSDSTTNLYLAHLRHAINQLDSGEDDENQLQFVQALNALYHELAVDIKKRVDKGADNIKILNSPAYKIIRETRSMLKELATPLSSPLDKQEYQLSILKTYKKNCTQSSCFGNFLKAVGAVFCAGVGCVVGAAIGLGVGIVAGSWTGPGAALTSLGGLTTGAITGAAACLAGGAAITGVAAASLGGYLLFKPDEKTKRINEVAEKGRQFVRARL